MDQITNEIWFTQWVEIIRNRQLRPEGQITKEWVSENGINIKTYYYRQRRVRIELYHRATSLYCIELSNNNAIIKLYT